MPTTEANKDDSTTTTPSLTTNNTHRPRGCDPEHFVHCCRNGRLDQVKCLIALLDVPISGPLFKRKNPLLLCARKLHSHPVYANLLLLLLRHGLLELEHYCDQHERLQLVHEIAVIQRSECFLTLLMQTTQQLNSEIFRFLHRSFAWRELLLQHRPLSLQCLARCAVRKFLLLSNHRPLTMQYCAAVYPALPSFYVRFICQLL